MTERTRTGKARSQDLAGFLFCALGAFFAVSIVLAMRGAEPSKPALQVLSGSVLELIHLLGALPALLLTSGVAVLGTMLFLRTQAMASARPLIALSLCAVGLALLLGAFGLGGRLGEVFPGLLAGFAGRALSAVLGLAVLWLGATLLPLSRPSRESGADAVQRIGLSARHDPAGVSSAEAALLVPEPRAVAPRAAVRPEPAVVREPTLRPYTPSKEALKPEPAKPSAPARAAAVAAPAPAPVTRPLTPVQPSLQPLATNLVPESPRTPSWASAELAQEEELEAEVAPLTARAEELEEEEVEPVALPAVASKVELSPATLAAELAHAFEDDEDGFEATEADEEAELEAEPALEAALPVESPRASWEQIGLFDENAEENADEEELEEEAAPVQVAKVETPAFDFDAGQAKAPLHEPEPPLEASEDPFALEPALQPTPAKRKAKPVAERVSEPLEELDAELDEEEAREAELEAVAALEQPSATLAPTPASAKARPLAPASTAPQPAVQADFVLAPAPKPAPVLAADEEGESWGKLVFDAGCAILEQKRVAVSMLERRFGIDFDRACLVLDELQSAGLIGPYIGGRTRDILLTREEWLAHAPHAS
ncbi:MAG: hypothetical protein EXS08_14055 [Planctomycetes bacterium]|nr:hypothetical protein [Planctomycetota bacterium]